MSAQVAADLRAAAEVLRRDGWTRGYFHDPSTGCHCAEGAIDAGVGYWRGRNQDYDDSVIDRDLAAVQAFEDFLGIGSLPDWNDAPGRTADEVIAALEAAAVRAEAVQ